MAEGLLLLLLLWPAVAVAEDTGAVMAALNDEASECRYVDRLCGAVLEARQQVSEVLALHRFDDDGVALTRAYLRVMHVRENDLLRGVRVLSVKHEAVPACIDDCVTPGARPLTKR